MLRKIIRSKKLGLLAAFALVFAISLMSASMAAAKEKLVFWSHWADLENCKKYVYEAIDRFKKKNPDWDVEMVWYQKPPLMTALTSAFQAGQGPDVFYLEPAITGAFPNFVDSGLMADIGKWIDPYIAPWAFHFAKKGKMTYLLPMEAYRPMLYYNTEIFKKVGVQVPASGRLDMDGFKGAVKKIKDAGFTPFSAGTMDREWCANIFIENIMLRYIGQEKWQGIATGKTAWTDPEVKASLKYIEDIVKMGAYPSGVSAIKLGESHGLFFGGKYGIFPMKTFFGMRAFMTPEKGGMQPDFPLGVMEFPNLRNGKANNLNYMQVGASFGVSALSKHPDKGAELLACMATPNILNMWFSLVKSETGLKTEGVDKSEQYYKRLDEVTKGMTFVPGPMELGMDATYRDVFFQTSTGFVGGMISADEMVKKLEEARAKVKK